MPVGALVVWEGQSIGCGYNTREAEDDPAGHAEITALRRAASAMCDWRLSNCDLYVTLERARCARGRSWPHAYGAWSSARGTRRRVRRGSVRDVLRDARSNHRVEVIGGVREDECAAQLTAFFRRQGKKAVGRVG